MTEIPIVDATAADVPGIAAILNDSIRHTTAVWYDTPKTMPEMQDWFAAKSHDGWPLLVARADGQVAGYATYGPFRPWPGYRATAEHSVYVGAGHRRAGIGRRLLQALVERAGRGGLHAMIGGIEAGNDASLRLHAALGFYEVGRLPEVGRKFDRWLTLVFMQRLLT